MIRILLNKFLLLGISTFLIGSLIGCDQNSSGGWTRDEFRKAATALYEKELYQEAIDVYQKYLYSSVIEASEKPKVLYQMGNLYLEQLQSPKEALAQYTLIKSLYPEETFNNKLGKKIVACLEQLGRRTDAKQALGNMTHMNPESSDSISGSTVVAEIDDQKITLNDIEALGPLPESPLEKNQAIQQFVVQMLIAESARRKGLADKPEIKRRIKMVGDQILAQENLREEIQITPPSEKDLQYFYEAHKEKYADDSLLTFEQAKQKALRDWQMEKSNEKYQVYVQDLLKSDRVKVYGVTGKGN